MGYPFLYSIWFAQCNCNGSTAKKKLLSCLYCNRDWRTFTFSSVPLGCRDVTLMGLLSLPVNGSPMLVVMDGFKMPHGAIHIPTSGEFDSSLWAALWTSERQSLPPCVCVRAQFDTTKKTISPLTGDQPYQSDSIRVIWGEQKFEQKHTVQYSWIKHVWKNKMCHLFPHLHRCVQEKQTRRSILPGLFKVKRKLSIVQHKSLLYNYIHWTAYLPKSWNNSTSMNILAVQRDI